MNKLIAGWSHDANNSDATTIYRITHDSNFVVLFAVTVRKLNI